MTSTTSLFACAAADVTLDRVRDLVGQGQPESLRLEYKERFTPRLVESVAAMANGYGGLILVGVTDRENRLVGVPEQTITQIVNACHEKLEPPWQPEIIPVSLPQPGGLLILVVRVDPTRAPRPILLDGKAPIRLQTRNATADRDRLAQLFAEASQWTPRARRFLPTPQLPTENGRPAADFMLRSGVQLAADNAATWRPLSERGVTMLAEALNNSPLQQVLLRWCGDLGITGINAFCRRGFNRSRHARLVWQAVVGDHCPIEVVAAAELPALYGAPDTALRFTLDIVGRLRAVIAPTDMPVGSQVPVWRLSVSLLYRLLDGLLATLTNQKVISALADLAGIDPLVVPQPPNLHLVTGPSVTDLLHLAELIPVEDAGSSHGANLFTNPALDLRDSADRQEQVDNSLLQIGLDAGLTGMDDYSTSTTRQQHHVSRAEAQPVVVPVDPMRAAVCLASAR